MFNKQKLSPKNRAKIRKNTIEYLRRLKAQQKPLVITAELVVDDEPPAPDLSES
jgi:hypothetical protein